MRLRVRTLLACSMLLLLVGCSKDITVQADAPPAHRLEHFEYWHSWGMDGVVAYITPTPLWFDPSTQTVFLTVWPDGSDMLDRAVDEAVGMTEGGTVSTSDSGDDVAQWEERVIVPRTVQFRLRSNDVDELVAKLDTVGARQNGEEPDPSKIPTDVGIGDAINIQVDRSKATQYTWTAKPQIAEFLIEVLRQEFWEQLTGQKGEKVQARLWLRVSAQGEQGPAENNATMRPFPVSELNVNLPMNGQSDACAWVDPQITRQIQAAFAEPRTPIWVVGTNPDGSPLRRAVYFTPIHPGEPNPTC